MSPRAAFRCAEGWSLASSQSTGTGVARPQASRRLPLPALRKPDDKCWRNGNFVASWPLCEIEGIGHGQPASMITLPVATERLSFTGEIGGRLNSSSIIRSSMLTAFTSVNSSNCLYIAINDASVFALVL